jgi:hypothetical protein
MKSNGILQGDIARLLIGLIALLVAWQMFSSQKVSAVFVALCSILWIGFNAFVAYFDFTDLRNLLSIYQDGRSQVTEGVVHVIHQQPAAGHSAGDKISLGGQIFEIDYFHRAPGYNQTVEHGGALKEGVPARLHHDNGVILKVEVKN